MQYRTPKLVADLLEFAPTRYVEYREAFAETASLLPPHLNGFGDWVGLRRAITTVPVRQMESSLEVKRHRGDPLAILSAAPASAFVFSAPDLDRRNEVLAAARQSHAPIMIWLAGRSPPDDLTGFASMRHRQNEGVRGGLLLLTYVPPLVHDKLHDLGWEIVQANGPGWELPSPKHGQRLRRWLNHKPPLVGIMELAKDHPALVRGRTLFRARFTHPADAPRIFVPGHNSRKIGGLVVKGKWAGMPIYTLTLEERRTCWEGCKHWSDCYANKMNWSRRLRHGAALDERIEKELGQLSREHPQGFVIRLHVLGDFPSVGYVRRWRSWLRKFPQLHVFGYTSWPSSTPVGAAVKALRTEQWERFAVRTSNQNLKRHGANTIRREPEAPVVPEGIVCPAQTERTECCGTCGLCWQTTKSIAFIAH